jgi:hypothetical protein
MKFYWLALGVLGVWRITLLLAYEDGPGEVLVGLRRAAGAGFWGKLLDCFYCLSVWIAIPFAYWLGDGWRERLLLWPALSGGAILLERASRGFAAAPALYHEDEEDSDALLREGKRTTPESGSRLSGP